MVTKVEYYKDRWRDLLSIYKEDYLKPKDHVFFWCKPSIGYLYIDYGESKLEGGSYPETDDYEFDVHYNLYQKDHDVLGIFARYNFGAFDVKFLVNGKIISGDSTEDEFNIALVEVFAEWTTEYFREIESPMKKIYFMDGDKNVKLTFDLNG